MADIVKIRDWYDSDDPEPENGWDWPTPDLCVESEVTGALHDRILARLAAPPETRITIIEREIEGGWSEYTVETDYQIEVQADGVKVWEYEYGWRPESCMAAFLKWTEEA